MGASGLKKKFDSIYLNYDLVWCIIRDLHCNARSLTGTYLVDSDIKYYCQSTGYKYALNKTKYSGSPWDEYVESFKNSESYAGFLKGDSKTFYNTYDSKTRLKIMRKESVQFNDITWKTIYPNGYCKYLDEQMLRQDGKREYFKLLRKIKMEKTKSNLLIIGIISFALVILFFFGKCTIGCLQP